MKRGVFLASGACLALAVSILGACGGGGDDPGAAAMAPQGTELRGLVIDGAPGAKVFLDLNNNQSYDAGEPATATLAEGTFTLHVGRRSAGELASAMLIAEVPDTARDRDDAGLTLKEADRGGYRLMAPAAASVRVDSAGRQATSPAVLSPLTTMVAAEVAFNGLTPGQAAKTVQEQLGLGDSDLLGDYNARGDSVLRNIARAAAIALGESPMAAGEPMRPQLAAATTRLKIRLPAVVKELDLKSDKQPSVKVASVKQALAAVPDPGPAISALAASGNRFIVKFRDSVRDPAERGRSMAGAGRAELRHTFSRALKGFAVTVPEDAVLAFLEATLQDPDVDRVEADGVVTTLQTVQSVQTNATWGLDRTDQRALPLSTTYSYFSTGKGVRAYIIDTGIFAHDDVRSRMVSGFTAIGDGRGTNDCHGHGTHVAGTVGGKTWGMAKEVTLVPVRVLDCNGSGSFSGVIAGIDWMVANAVKPAVANMSLGGSRSALVDEAVARAVAAGITVSVAAGNSGLNACDFSPAAEPTALTVGATTSADARASFSNYGTCLDLFAPGASITSAGISSRNATALMSGTSMAAPHVAGLAALYLQSNRTASPAEVGDAIRAAASTGKVSDAGFGSPDALIHTDLSSVPPPPEPPISSPEPPISSPEQPPPPSVSVAALSGNSSMIDSKNWRASVTVAVKDASGSLVPGVVVKGKFTAGGSRVGCTTAPNGTCDIMTGKLGGRKLQTQFTVVGLTLSGMPYDPSLNAVTTLVIAKP